MALPRSDFSPRFRSFLRFADIVEKMALGEGVWNLPSRQIHRLRTYFETYERTMKLPQKLEIGNKIKDVISLTSFSPTKTRRICGSSTAEPALTVHPRITCAPDGTTAHAANWSKLSVRESNERRVDYSVCGAPPKMTRPISVSSMRTDGMPAIGAAELNRDGGVSYSKKKNARYLHRKRRARH